MGVETQLRGKQVKDKSVKAIDTDFTTAAAKVVLSKDDYLILINSASAGLDTEKILASDLANSVASLIALDRNFIDGIVGATKGIIQLADFVGTVVGSYDCELNIDLSDLSNSLYRLTANRKVKFSLTIYQNGATIYHSLPDLVVCESSGQIVKLSDQTITYLNYEDIYLQVALVSNMLEIYLWNGIGTSEIPAANGTIKAIYTLKITKFNYA